MKKIAFPFLAIVMMLAACTKTMVTEQYTYYRPVYKTKDAVRNNVRNSQVETILQPGKLVWKDNYVFLNDVDRGVHIIDISNPAQPKLVSFIHIPGCVDLAINDHYLYADCYTDLVTIDIADPLQIAVKQFLPGVFPHRRYTGFIQDTGKVIEEWIRVDTIVKRAFHDIDREGERDNWLIDSGVFFSAATGGQNKNTMAGQGIAGSMARFALLDKRMYTVSYSDLKTFSIVNAAAPSYVATTEVAMNTTIETIFPYQDKLFIGSQNGMFIYHTQNVDKPQLQGQFTHVRSCDPVIADNGFAYVTLKGGGVCGGASNQLDILNIADMSNPKLVKSYNLSSPAGLSKDGDMLFICDGLQGLRIFNVATPTAVTNIRQIPGFDAYDVIASNGLAIVVAKDGLHLIDYTSPFDAKEVGKLLMTKN
jgi:hypothetical protein